MKLATLNSINMFSKTAVLIKLYKCPKISKKNATLPLRRAFEPLAYLSYTRLPRRTANNFSATYIII